MFQSNMDVFTYNDFNRFFQADTNAKFTPAVDIEETEDSFVLRADLPGVKEKDIEVTVHDGTLILSGKRELTNEDEAGTYRERSFGAFSRQFLVGDSIVESSITAKSKNGELMITLPKKEESKPRQIKVFLE